MKLEWNRKYTTIAVYTVLTALAIMLLCALFLNFDGVKQFFATANSILSPFYIGLAIAYLANPIMVMSEKHIFRFKVTSKKRASLKRGLSITLAFIILLIIVIIIFLLIIPQVTLSLSDLASKLTGYIDRTADWLDDYLPESVFDSANLTIDNFFNTLVGYLTNSSIGDELSDLSGKLDLLSANLDTLIANSLTIIKEYMPIIFSAFAGVANGVLNVIIGIFFAIYILASKEKLIAQVKKVLRSVTGEKMYNEVLELGSFTHKTFGGYLVGKVLDSLIVGVVMFIVCAICNIPYAILVSTLVGITNIIPVIGPFIGAIPGILIIFIVDPSKVLWFILINVIIQQIDGNIIVPKVLGETTGLSSLWVLFSITVMGSIWGLFGMFISVPIFAVLYMLIKQLVENRLIKKGLSADTLDYYTENEIRDLPEDDKNSLAYRIKNSSTVHLGVFERIKNKFKKKSDKNEK